MPGGLSSSSPAFPSSLLSSSSSQHQSLYRDTPTSSPPSSHDRFLLNSSQNYARSNRPSTSSTDSLEVSMGFKRLLSKPADPPSRRRSTLGLGQTSNLKSLSDSEGLVAANKRTRPGQGTITDVESDPRPKRLDSTLSDAKSSPLASNQAHHSTHSFRHTPTSSYHTVRHPSRSPLPSNTAGESNHVSLGSFSDSSDLDISKSTTPSTPPKSRNVLRRKNSFARDQQQERKIKSVPAPSFQIPTPNNHSSTKRKPPETVPHLTPAGAVARAYMAQELRREALAHSAHSSIPQFPNQIPHSNTSPRSLSPLTDLPNQGRKSSDQQTPFIGAKSGRLVAIGSPDDSSSSTRSTLPHPCSETSLPLPGNNPSQPSLASSTASCCIYSAPATPKEQTLNRKRSFGLFTATKPSTPPSSASKAQFKAAEELSSSASIDSPTNVTGHGNGNKLWRLMKRISTGGLRDKFHAEEPPPPVPALPAHFNISAEKSCSDTGHDIADQPRQSKSKSRPLTASTPTKVEAKHYREVPAVYQYRASTNVPPSPRPPPSTRARSSTTTVSPIKHPVSPKSSANPSQTTLMSDDSGVFSSDSAPKTKDLERHILPPSEINARMDPNRPPSTTLLSKYPPPTPQRVASPSPEDESVDIGLPIPPRGGRRGPADTKISYDDLFLHGRDSPLLPSFSTEGAINTFGPRSRPSLSDRMLPSTTSLAEFSIDTEVRRTLKKRPSLKAILLPRGQDLVSKKEKMSRPSTAVGSSFSVPLPSLDVETGKPPRPSRHPSRPPPGEKERRQTNASEPAPDELVSESKPRPRSNSFSGQPTSAGKESGHRSASHSTAGSRASKATFKTLDSTPKQLSELEKMKRWDELLARSDRAGGTLHLGGVDRLESDWL